MASHDLHTPAVEPPPRLGYTVREMFHRLLLALAAVLAAASAHASTPEIVVSVRRQTMTVLDAGARKSQFAISTSKFGVGSQPRSYRTPLGTFTIERKVGAGHRPGTVFKGLRATGEVVAPNAPGRDPIVTRVLCLSGGSAGSRGIYIHGTPEEALIGRPASYGCIRMRSRDVIALFDTVPVGARVVITDAPSHRTAALSPAAVEAGTEEWFR